MGGIKIGKHELSSPVILAPMSGVTDKPFRKIVRKHYAPLLVTEMVASRVVIERTRKAMKRCEFDHEGGLTSVQLAGCESEMMAEAAKINEDMKASIIDINFGCPAKKVVNSYSGSALMRDEKKAAKIIEATVNAVNIPVTLKMRMGWDDTSLNAPILAKIAEDLGVQMITIHGRTRCQFYKGDANWKFISKVKEMVKIPVIVNGDIKVCTDVTKSLNESGADGVMVGRGAYGKPWIIDHFSRYLESGIIKEEPSLEHKRNIMKEHYEENLFYYGKEIGMLMSRKHISWYSKGLPNSAVLRQGINTSTNPKVVLKLIDDFFEQCEKNAL